jgi:hypothetical protein
MQQGTSIVVAVLAGALGGVLGNLATGWLKPHTPEPKPATADYAEDMRDLSARVSALDAQLTRLSQQRRMEAFRPAQAPAAQASADVPARAVTDDPVFEAAVRDVMDKMQKERDKARDDRREQAAQRWADQLGDKLELTDKQKAGVLGVAEDVLSKMREMREADPAAPPGPNFREQRTAMISQGEQRLGEILSAHQMQVYKESPDLRLDAVMRGGWGPGRGGP